MMRPQHVTKMAPTFSLYPLSSPSPHQNNGRRAEDVIPPHSLPGHVKRLDAAGLGGGGGGLDSTILATRTSPPRLRVVYSMHVHHNISRGPRMAKRGAEYVTIERRELGLHGHPSQLQWEHASSIRDSGKRDAACRNTSPYRCVRNQPYCTYVPSDAVSCSPRPRRETSWLWE